MSDDDVEVPEKLLTNSDLASRKSSLKNRRTRRMNKIRSVNEIIESVKVNRYDDATKTNKLKKVKYEPIEAVINLRMDIHDAMMCYTPDLKSQPDNLSDRRWQRYLALMREAKHIDMEIAQYLHSKKKTITIDIDAIDLQPPTVNLEINDEVIGQWIKSNPEKASAVLKQLVLEVEIDESN
jgi:hypothetical protein